MQVRTGLIVKKKCFMYLLKTQEAKPGAEEEAGGNTNEGGREGKGREGKGCLNY